MVKMVEKFNRVWAPFASRGKKRMSTYILRDAWDVTVEGNIRKWYQWLPLGKENGRRRKDGKEICLSSCTVFNLLISCMLYIYYPVKSYVEKKHTNFERIQFSDHLENAYRHYY